MLYVLLLLQLLPSSRLAPTAMASSSETVICGTWLTYPLCQTMHKVQLVRSCSEALTPTPISTRRSNCPSSR